MPAFNGGVPPHGINLEQPAKGPDDRGYGVNDERDRQ